MNARLETTQTTLGATLVLGAAAVAGSGAILAKVAYAQGFEPVSMLAVRFIIASAVLTPIGLVLWPAQFRVSPQVLALLGALAVMNLGAAWFYFSALSFAPASIVAPLHFTYPAMVMLLSRLRGEGLQIHHVGALIVGWLGIWMLSGAAWTDNPRVITYSLASAATYSVYLVIARSVLGRISVQASLTYLLIFLAIGSSLLWASTDQHAGNAVVGWIAVAAIAIISTVITRLVFYAGLKRIGSNRTALLGMAEPLAVLIFAAVVLGERLTRLELGGAALILVSGAWSMGSLNPEGIAQNV